MMSNSLSDQFQKINELLKEAKKVLITSHENPDADAAGSVLALHRVFKKQGLSSFPYLPDKSPKYLNFLPDFYEIKAEISPPFLDSDLLFCLDYGDFERLQLPDHFLEKTIITIDHHGGSDQRGQVKIVAPEFSSTAEIIYLWMSYTGLEIDKEIATCLLSGIVSDSGGFCHVSTSSQTLNIVSELLLKGAPLTKISRQALVLDSNPPAALKKRSKIWGQALSRIKKDQKTGLVYSWLTFREFKESGINPVDLTGISSLISTASQNNFSLFLVEYEKGKIKGSLRSEPFKGMKVDALAEALGGGGHPYAAGFRIKGTVEETLKKVLNVIE